MSPRGVEAGHKRAAYHHGDLAPALLAEALAVVRAAGKDALSLRQVALAVGVSPSAAYAHFADKEALLRAVAVEGERSLDEALQSAVAAVPGDDDGAAVARFLAAGEAYIGWAASEPHLFRHTFGPYCRMVAGEATGTDELDQLKDESVSFALLQQGIADLYRRGLLFPQDTTGLELVLWTSVHGFAWLMLEGHLPPAAAGELFAAIARTLFNERGQQLIAQSR